MQNKIKYSQCWEDAEILLKALKINKNDKVVSITSGGDNTLSLITNNPSEIYAVDSNFAQNYLMELKLKAIQNLDCNIKCYYKVDVLKYLHYHFLFAHHYLQPSMSLLRHNYAKHLECHLYIKYLCLLD